MKKMQRSEYYGYLEDEITNLDLLNQDIPIQEKYNELKKNQKAVDVAVEILNQVKIHAAADH